MPRSIFQRHTTISKNTRIHTKSNRGGEDGKYTEINHIGYKNIEM